MNRTTFLSLLFAASLYLSGQHHNQPCFLENRGQISDQYGKARSDILYRADDAGQMFYLQRNGWSFQIPFKPYALKTAKTENTTGMQRVDMHLEGSNPHSRVLPRKPLRGVRNYFNESGEGILGVKSFEEIVYENIYPGIDLIFHFQSGEMKYDYYVRPGANYTLVQHRITGAQKTYVNSEGELVIETPAGIICEKRPIVMQAGKSLTASWKVHGHVASFLIVGARNDQPILIDPLVRIWATLFGGNKNDYINDVKIVDSGDLVVCGTSDSQNNIATSGSHQNLLNETTDAFLGCFDNDGTLKWCTYYGGTKWETGDCLALNEHGDIFMAGTATSSSGISTSASHQPVKGGDQNPSVTFGPERDIFLAKFNSSGVRVWGTYYGGDERESAPGVATDAFGNVFLSGITNSDSAGVIATPNSFQPVYNGTTAGHVVEGNPFLVKFRDNGTRVWATYNGTGHESAANCAVDAAGNCYMIGVSRPLYSSTFFGTSGAHQTTHADVGYGFDGFITKFDSLGNRLWSTYYGGMYPDCILDCTTDSLSLYITGWSQSTGTAIASPNSHQPLNAGLADAYLAKFNSAGMRIWGTFLGNSNESESARCVRFKHKKVMICGNVGPTIQTGTTGIATAGAYQPQINGILNDGFAAFFDDTGSLQYATYYGSPGTDYLNSGDFDLDSWVIGGSTSTTVNALSLVTPGAHQTILGGQSDGILARFEDCSLNIGIPNCVNLNELDDQSIRVFPNPFNNKLTIKSAVEGTFKLHNLCGEIVRQGLLQAGETAMEISAGAGLYFLTLKSANFSRTYKVLKKG